MFSLEIIGSKKGPCIDMGLLATHNQGRCFLGFFLFPFSLKFLL